jgi:hypothetical protein
MVVWENYGKPREDQDFSVAFWQSQPLQVPCEEAFDLSKVICSSRKAMLTSPDFKELLDTFRKHNVRN